MLHTSLMYMVLVSSALSFNIDELPVVGTIKKARCLVPSGVEEITRTLFLQKCLSKNGAEANESSCYEELGCFNTDSPWISILRPFPAPLSPAEIETKLYLFTRSSPKYNVSLWPEVTLNGSHFKPSRENTVIIVHGFASNGSADWMHLLKDAYLKKRDANIFIVDWGKGAALKNYLQVASNTRIVGAELARFGRYLQSHGLKLEDLHLIGHSLGAHISGYMAKGLNRDSVKVGRITALDPAQPGFEATPETVRLSQDDAILVDVLHTNAKPFIPFFGLGMVQPVGHVDFYLNGGSDQPGCACINQTFWIKRINSLEDLLKVQVEVIQQYLACSHSRAHEIFVSSVQEEANCTIWGRRLPSLKDLFSISSSGNLIFHVPLARNLDECTEEVCTVIGLHTPQFKPRGFFLANTRDKVPFCDKMEAARVPKALKDGLSDVMETLTSPVKSGLRRLEDASSHITGWLAKGFGKK